MNESPSFLESRVATLEASVRALEARVAAVELSTSLASPMRQVEDSLPSPRKAPQGLISVTMLGKSYHPIDIRGGDVGNRIDFVFQFQSHLERSVRAFKGAVILSDLFGEQIFRITLLHEATLPARGTAVWKGGIKYNQFLATHQRLRTIDRQDIALSFECESLIYTDGTRENIIV